MDSPFTNTMETFNEVMTIFSLYFLMYFTNFVEDAIIKYTFGSYFMVLISFYLLVHVIFIMNDMLRLIIRKLKSYCNKLD